MKRILFLLLLLPTLLFAQKYQPPLMYGQEQNRGAFWINLGIPSDTFTIPIAYRGQPHLAYQKTTDRLYIWSPVQQRWIFYTTGGSGSIDSIIMASKYYVNTQLALKQNKLTTGVSTQYFAGDLTLRTLATDVLAQTDPKYSLLGHTHNPADITGLTAYIRGAISVIGNGTYNTGTGVINITGGGTGTYTFISPLVNDGSGNISLPGIDAALITSGTKTNTFISNWTTAVRSQLSALDPAFYNSSTGVITVDTSYRLTTRYLTYKVRDSILLYNLGKFISKDSLGNYSFAYIDTAAGLNLYDGGINPDTLTQRRGNPFVTGYIHPDDFNHFNTAYGWGNHATFGYLNSTTGVPSTRTITLNGTSHALSSNIDLGTITGGGTTYTFRYGLVEDGSHNVNPEGVTTSTWGSYKVWGTNSSGVKGLQDMAGIDLSTIVVGQTLKYLGANQFGGVSVQQMDSTGIADGDLFIYRASDRTVIPLHTTGTRNSSNTLYGDWHFGPPVSSIVLTVLGGEFNSVTLSNSAGAWTGTMTKGTEPANTVAAGPTSGGSGGWIFRALVAADLPGIDASKIISGLMATARLASGTASAGFVPVADGSGNVVWTAQSGGGAVSEPANQIFVGTGTSHTSYSDFIYNSSTNKLSIGTTAATSTTTPHSIDFGGDFSPTAAANPKIKIFNDGTNYYGIGFSSAAGPQMDIIGTHSGSNFVWTIAGTEKLRINGTSATFANSPIIPTPSANDNSTKAASTAYVDASAALKANLASPGLTGVPTAPTASGGTNTTQLATTAFVTGAINNLITVTRGTYTPPLTSTTQVNITSVTSHIFKYTQVGDMITVSGVITVQPTASGALTSCTFEIPSTLSSTFTTVYQASGTFNGIDNGAAGVVLPDIVNGGRVKFSFKSVDNTSHDYYCIFQYQQL